ncbi:hypothetical protein VE23_20250 [Paenibacillus sp. D9]|uniref:GNAT family N-acetyltransferase n=1 Tax=Paenibacillus sp. D9 TaxID=665792 RepID=UPI00061F1B12|nr:GNAT family N-acetyltransferase [Paenibacillus sp. D9]KKC48880.1 hypothetical protein VE23_20250 [Paenibacillus sp. D9]
MDRPTSASITARLQSDPLLHITLLKMLESFGGGMTAHMAEEGEQWGALLLLPAELNAYDRLTYPEASHAGFLAGNSDSLLLGLLDRLPESGRFVFKLQLPRFKAILASRFRLEKARGFYTYTAGDTAFQAPLDGRIVETSGVDDGLASFWTPPEAEELLGYINKGARLFALYEGDEPASVCAAFPNFGPIWEIGFLRTRERFQGRGLAKQVVSAAMASIGKDGRIARYHVLETNEASIKVAESVGLSRAVHLEHFLTC